VWAPTTFTKNRDRLLDSDIARAFFEHVVEQSTTDPDSRLFKKAKGHEAKLAYLGEVLMENRHGLSFHRSAVFHVCRALSRACRPAPISSIV
jgi:hypothetical protein